MINANKLLKEQLRSQPNIHYWKFKGIQEIDSANFEDGVHMSATGKVKYYRAIRGAVLHCQDSLAARYRHGLQ